MRVVGVDPGTTHSAAVLLVEGRIEWFDFMPNGDLVALMRNRNQWLSVKHPGLPDLAIEMIESQGFAVGRETFETVYWIGRFAEAWSTMGRWHAKVTRIGRSKVKLAATGRASCKDKHVRAAMIERYGCPKGERCPICKGKGWVGRGRPTCETCGGSGWLREPATTKGMVSHHWQALATASAYLGQLEEERARG